MTLQGLGGAKRIASTRAAGRRTIVRDRGQLRLRSRTTLRPCPGRGLHFASTSPPLRLRFATDPPPHSSRGRYSEAAQSADEVGSRSVSLNGLQTPTQDVESIERKLRAYDAHQSQYLKFDPNRYLVLFVTTRSDFRVSHILQLANAVIQHPGRTVFLGASLSAWLSHDPFRDAILSDHRGLKRTLVPMDKSAAMPDLTKAGGSG